MEQQYTFANAECLSPQPNVEAQTAIAECATAVLPQLQQLHEGSLLASSKTRTSPLMR